MKKNFNKLMFAMTIFTVISFSILSILNLVSDKMDEDRNSALKKIEHIMNIDFPKDIHVEELDENESWYAFKLKDYTIDSDLIDIFNSELSLMYDSTKNKEAYTHYMGYSKEHDWWITDKNEIDYVFSRITKDGEMVIWDIVIVDKVKFRDIYMIISK